MNTIKNIILRLSSLMQKKGENLNSLSKKAGYKDGSSLWKMLNTHKGRFDKLQTYFNALGLELVVNVVDKATGLPVVEDKPLTFDEVIAHCKSGAILKMVYPFDEGEIVFSHYKIIGKNLIEFENNTNKKFKPLLCVTRKAYEYDQNIYLVF